MIRASLSALERRLCSPKYLDVPALHGTGRVIGGESLDLGPAAAVIVGEAPGPNTSTSAPVFPYPASSAGGRLLALAGIQAEEYLRRFARRNLLDHYPGPGGWTKSERIAAQDRAAEIFEAARGGRIILLGAQVARAFGPVTGEALVTWEARRDDFAVGGTTFAHLPHPSGRNRFLNSDEARWRVRLALRDLASTDLPPCPSCDASPAAAYEYPWEVTCHCGARLNYRRGVGGIVEIDWTEAA